MMSLLARMFVVIEARWCRERGGTPPPQAGEGADRVCRSAFLRITPPPPQAGEGADRVCRSCIPPHHPPPHHSPPPTTGEGAGRVCGLPSFHCNGMASEA